MKLLQFAIFLCIWPSSWSRSNFRTYSQNHLDSLRDRVSAMFHFAYDGYLNYAYPYDELRPLSCDGVDTWGSYSLTLIDALDTLAIMGNYTEFQRVYELLSERTDFDANINVSVFETNIRIVGGLLSAHLLARKAGVKLEAGWPCTGPLLRLAEDAAKRLLPAFDTPTGMPYGTVNLRTGVPNGETPVTSTAGVGTVVIEFGALSRLTGNPVYEEAAMRAMRALWHYKSNIGLVGNHVDVSNGKWTATDAGIGAAVDSYYEYLVKGSALLQKPELMKMFVRSREAIEQYMNHDDWHFWVSMKGGGVTLPVFQSLEAFWPGLLSLAGDNMAAMKSIHNYHQVWKQYGFLPEFYNVPQNGASHKRESYPLRPELIESAMYLYKATKDPFLLSLGEDMLNSIEYSAKTKCGYATVKDVKDHTLEDRMESFFLAETTKYLYLLFDVNNDIIHKPKGVIVKTPFGECVVESGGWIFNTEAHPIDAAALHCCSGYTELDIKKHLVTHMVDIFNPEKFREFEGDLIPKRVKQIQEQRKKENEAKLQRQFDYDKKMSEQREKEREILRKQREETKTAQVNNSKLLDLEYDNVELNKPDMNKADVDKPDMKKPDIDEANKPEMKNEPLEKKVNTIEKNPTENILIKKQSKDETTVEIFSDMKSSVLQTLNDIVQTYLPIPGDKKTF